VIQAPSENPFAFFYASVRDPFGVIIQLTVEKEVDPSKKGE
jgi:PhnB protein